MKPLPLILLALFAGTCFTSAQSVYSINDVGSLKVAGTSTMHDWEMEKKKISGKAEFVLDGNELKGIRSLRINIAPESLKSGKGAMDKNAYKALKTDTHKEITFALTRVTKVERSGNKFTLTCEGNLTIAGKTKPVQLIAECRPGANGNIQCTGTKAISMTEYDVEPPSFMFGSVKTGDEVQIVFDVVFAKS